jgi:hypothetical protein
VLLRYLLVITATLFTALAYYLLEIVEVAGCFVGGDSCCCWLRVLVFVAIGCYAVILFMDVSRSFISK